MEAVEAYGRAAEIVPELAPWLSVRAAEVLAQLGDTIAVHDRLRAATGVPLYRRTLAAVEAHLEAGDRPGALGLLLDAASAPEVGSRSIELSTRAARLLLEDGDSATAARKLRAVIRSGPGPARLSRPPTCSPSSRT